MSGSAVGDDVGMDGGGFLGGHLLLSNASLFDPNFRRTVVLIGHHDEEGAVGVVLNRPLDVSVDEAVPPLSDLVRLGDLLFEGGPVQTDAAVVVAEFEDPSKAGVIAFGSIGFLPEEADPEDLGGIVRARVFAGYSGWGAGQLEGELEEDAWLVTPALPEDVFHPEPERLWEDVLRRMGPAFALLRTMPEDPSLN
jgi:putative transcriptional regulator